MRLTSNEKEIITNYAIQIFGSGTQVILFGSRVSDTSRGGDIDLLIIPSDDSILSDYFSNKIQFKVKVLDRIGDQKMDVIVKYPEDSRGIIQTAINEGVRLC
jgi:uncharacterized protein